jgi:hypothetical protein
MHELRRHERVLLIPDTKLMALSVLEGGPRPTLRSTSLRSTSGRSLFSHPPRGNSFLPALALILAGATLGAAPPAASADGWKKADFAAATCNYISPPMGLSFSLPPGFLTLNPKRGPGAGCFWGTKEDLDRVITAEGPNFEKLVRGVFQARLSTNVAFDHSTGLFSGEEELEILLKNAGVTGGKIGHRKFGKHPGLVVTGKTREGSSLYLVYLAHGLDDNVLLINYRPATPPRPRRRGGLDAIPRLHPAGELDGPSTYPEPREGLVLLVSNRPYGSGESWRRNLPSPWSVLA